MTGRVTGADDGASLPDATVQVVGTGPGAGTGVATGPRGRYRIELPAPGRYTLAVRHVGYSPQFPTVALDGRGDVTLDVALQLEAQSLASLTVIGVANTLAEDARAIASLDAATLADVRGQTLGETLSRLPGVTTLQTGPSISKPVIRGLHSDRIVVLNNGIRQEGQQWGGEHAPALDPFAPAEIHVVKGAAGVEHGVGAIGGVVRLEPSPLPATPDVRGALTLNGFSNNRQGAGSLRLEGGVPGRGGFAWRVQGSGRRAGDAHTPDAVLRNTAFAEQAGSVTLGWMGEQAGAEVQVSRYATDLGIFRGAHSATLDDFRNATSSAAERQDEFSFTIDTPKQSVTHDMVSVKGHVNTDGGDRWEMQYGVQRNVRQEFDAHCRFCDDPGAEPAFDLELVTHTVDATWRSRPFANDAAFAVVGVSGMNQGNANGESGYLIPNFRALTGGLFARTAWMVGDVTLEAGARLDGRRLRAFPRERGTRGFAQETNRYLGLSTVVGALWQWAPTWSLGVNAATAWRPPNVNELYSYGVHHGAAQFEIGDADLKSERVLSVDATVRHQSARVQLEASSYATLGRDFISLLPTGDPVVTIRGVFPEFTYRQTGARLWGVDGGLEVDAGGPLRMGATLSLVRGTDTTNDQPLFDMPSDRLGVFAGIDGRLAPRFPEGSLRVTSTWVRRQTRLPATDFAPAPDGYAVASVDAGLTVPAAGTDVRVRLSVDNVFDTAYRDVLSRYRYFADEPGRTVVLRLTVPFGPTS